MIEIGPHLLDAICCVSVASILWAVAYAMRRLK